MAAKNANTTAAAEDRVMVVVPRDPGGDTMIFVALNGKPYNIPRGKPVELPANVAQIIYNSLAAEEAALAFSAQQKQLMNEIQGAPK